MGLIEKDVVLTSKDGDGNTVVHKPYTTVEQVEGAVATVNGNTPDGNGNVVLDIENAKRAYGIPFVVPNETASTATLTVTYEGIDSLYDGLVLAVRMPFSNAASSTLNLNGLGAKPIYYQNTTTSASRMPTGTVTILVYDTVSVSTGCWKIIYSYNADNTARQYQTTSNVEYPMICRYNNTDKGTSYETTYLRYAMGVTLNPSKGTITASGGFIGTVSKATADADGNVIADTYAKRIVYGSVQDRDSSKPTYGLT